MHWTKSAPFRLAHSANPCFFKDSMTAKQFDEVYSPNLVFNRLGVDLWFEDNWTIHFKYKSQQGCLEMLKLASELGLFILPAYCADHLNNYEVLSDFMRKNGLDKSLHRDFVAAA